MPVHLVITANLDRARAIMEDSQNMQARGPDRGFLPSGKEVLIKHEDLVAAAAPGLELSGYEYQVSNLDAGQKATLETILDGQVVM